ncbi:hypothetical protein GCM10012284_21830 [Mangrovihabitans endophyticus]|uniref:Uncharacterized protein n=1 Tax=Mangrovihabitans endophyticus TaxID=1751298 RepID=A0A8J3FNW3_9ACTN|nr:hypothetical protein GCM10012284_21830 [Mangrovihabitans endophyticus]
MRAGRCGRAGQGERQAQQRAREREHRAAPSVSDHPVMLPDRDISATPGSRDARRARTARSVIAEWSPSPGGRFPAGVYEFLTRTIRPRDDG